MYVCTGYSSVVDLLEAMPDVVRFEFSTKHNDYCLYGIADRNCYLPSWVQKAQGCVLCTSNDFPCPCVRN